MASSDEYVVGSVRVSAGEEDRSIHAGRLSAPDDPNSLEPVNPVHATSTDGRSACGLSDLYVFADISWTNGRHGMGLESCKRCVEVTGVG
jgi:hypothetical protein